MKLSAENQKREEGGAVEGPRGETCNNHFSKNEA